MTASITPCCASPDKSLRYWLCALCLLVAPLIVHAQAERNVVRYAEIIQSDDGYVVNADIDFELGPRLTEALHHGVSLHFVLEFELERGRWYWFDRQIASRNIHFRLSHHSITRSYRLSIGGLHHTFDSLDSALRAMRRVRNWHIVELDELETAVSYKAALRLRHDTSRLPQPFQVSAIGNRDWSVGTDWLRWTFLAGTTR